MQRAIIFEPLSAVREPNPRIELIRRDSGETLQLDAATLVAQYALASGDVLLVLDEDTLYEERLHLVLVEGVTVDDHLVIGAPYATGLFREVGIRDDRLCMRFAGDEALTVSVAPASSRLPQRLPAGVRRRGGWLAPHRLAIDVGEA